MELPADIWTKMVLPAVARGDRWALGRCSKQLLEAADELDRDEDRLQRMVFITDVACNEERMAWAKEAGCPWLQGTFVRYTLKEPFTRDDETWDAMAGFDNLLYHLLNAAAGGGHHAGRAHP